MSDIFKLYKTRLKQSFDYCTPHWNRSLDNYKHYLGRLDTGGISENDYLFHSKMSTSISYEVVETVMPRLIGKDPEFTTIAVEPDDVAYERTAKMAVDLAYNNPKLELLGEPIYLKLQRGVKEQLITGNAVYRAFWRRENQMKTVYSGSLERTGDKDMPYKELTKKLKDNGMSEYESEITYSKKTVDSPYLDDFDIRHIPFFMFFPDVPMIETGRMRFKIERDYMTYEELVSEAEIFGYDKAVMQEIASMVAGGRMSFTPDLSKDFLQEYNDLFQTFDYKTFSTDDDKIPMLIVDKMWCGDRVSVFVNEKYNLTGDKGMPNPYDVKKAPFIFGHDVVIPHSYFSYGEIDAIKKIEDGMNDMANMRFDNLINAMLNFWLVNPNLIDAGDEFKPIPGAITQVQDVNQSVRLINGGDVTPTVYRETDGLYAMAQRISGINDYVKGGEGETLAGRTYGGLRLVQEAANARFIVKSRLFEKLTLKSLGYFALEMSKQFINKDRVVRYFGENDEPIEKTVKAGELKSIKGMIDMRVIPNSSMVVDQQAEAMKMNALADRMMTEKGAFAGWSGDVNDKFLLRYLPLFGVTDAPYWVRMIKENREKVKEEAMKQQAAEQKPPTALPAPPAPPTMPAGLDMLQSNGVVQGQPDPLAAIMNSGAMPIQQL